MADVEFGINCGCGYKTKRLEEAEMHSDETHHTLTVLGSVKSTASLVQVAKTKKPTDAESSIAGSMAGIEALRTQFKGGA